MKIFADYKAKRKYTDIYEALPDDQRALFADRIRRTAKAKVESLDDNLTEFYLTENDVLKCLEGIK